MFNRFQILILNASTIVHVLMGLLCVFSGHWPLNHVLCDFYVTLDVLLCTSSIMHLCTISLERFLAIRSPLKSRTRTKTAVRIKILLVWLLSFSISSPIMILGFVDERNILSDNQCVLQNKDFRIYGSVSAFYIPLIFMVISFGLTIRLLRIQYKLCNPKDYNEGFRRIQSNNSKTLKKRLKQLQKEQSHRNIKRQQSSSSTVSEESLTKLEQSKPLVTRSSEKQMCKHRLKSFTEFGELVLPPISKTCCLDDMDPQMQLHDIHEHGSPMSESEEEEFIRRSQSADTRDTSIPTVSHQSSMYTDSRRFSDMNDNPTNIPQTFSAPSDLNENSKRHNSSGNGKLKKDSVKQKQEKHSVRTEQKASKTLGILFVSFVVCWGPFFIVNVLEVWCTTCRFDPLLVTVFVWLGYVSSTLNPIIYTVFNKTFRVTMLKLLKCQYRAIQRPMRVKAATYSMSERSNTNVQIPL